MFIRKRAVILCLLVAACCGTACKRSPAAREARFLEHGQALLAVKDYARAAIEFSNAAKINPNRAETWYDLAEALLGAGRTRDAVGALRRTLSIQPAHSGAQIRLSELMVQSRDPGVLGDAIKRLDELIAADGNQPEALELKALAELKLNKTEDAIKHLEQELDRFPGRLRSSAALANVQFWRGDFAGAEKTLKSAAAAAPASIPAALALAQLYLAEKKPAEAEAEIRRAIGIDSSDGAPWMALGSVQMLLGKTGEAERTFRTAASLPKANLSYVHAAFLLRTGKRDEAISEFKQLAAGGDRAARLRLIGAHLTAGSTADALGILAELLRENPKDTEALIYRSRVRLQSGAPLEAAADLEQVLHFVPQSVDAHYGLSRVYAALGRQRMQENELAEVVRLRSDLLAPRLELAHAQIAGGKPETAIQTIDAAPAAQRDSVASIETRNWALLAANRRGEAASGVKRGMSIRPTVALLEQSGILKFANRDYAGARGDARLVLQRDPTQVRSMSLLVQSHVAQNQTAAALEVLRAAVSAEPKSPEILLTASRWYLTLRKPTEARNALQLAKAAAPANSQIDLAIAALDASEGKNDVARAALSDLVRREPQSQTALLMLATLEYETKNTISALAHYRSVIALAPDNVVALNNAACLIALSDPDQALAMAEKAIDLAPANPSVQDTLGWVYYRKGLYSKAVAVLQSAVAKGPSAVNEFHLAMALLKIGEKARGTELLNRALAKNPDVVRTEQGW